jgi:hypothetical protein
LILLHCSQQHYISSQSLILNTQGAPTLIIGHHQLKGTSVNLKEPFAVLRKRKFSESGGSSNNNNSNGSSERENKLLKRHGGGKVQYEVAGIVRKKLMFDQYPKSIMR